MTEQHFTYRRGVPASYANAHAIGWELPGGRVTDIAVAGEEQWAVIITAALNTFAKVEPNRMEQLLEGIDA